MDSIKYDPYTRIRTYYGKKLAVRRQLRRSIIHGQNCFATIKKKVKDKLIILKYYILYVSIESYAVRFFISFLSFKLLELLVLYCHIIDNEQYSIMFITIV